MAVYGEWNLKGGTLSEATAEKEYGVTRDVIVEGIKAGELEYRNSSMWGNPTFKISRERRSLSACSKGSASHVSSLLRSPLLTTVFSCSRPR